MSRTLFSFALLVTLGAGCAPTQPPPQAQAPVLDSTPGVNEGNCVKSGGKVDGDACDCPAGYDADPAGFCLDAQGRPGGEMAPK